jgi:pimeloyl-ACP methyl ester carboxylesterase
MTNASTRRPPGSVLLLLVAIVLAVGGGWLADRVRTDAGRVDVETIHFVAEDGRRMAADLYVPETAVPAARAPGVLAVHGYINDRGTQSPYAIELARRGYVVLSIDQPGHGNSDPPAFAAGYGGPDGLAHLRSLPMVDSERIALIGHSMGGWAALIAAGTAPDAYQAVAVSGSSTGTLGAPEGTPTFPRNLGLVFSRYDEFSELMWGAPTGAAIPETEKLADLFGTEPPVEPRRLYGDIDEGTARWLAQPPVTHPGDHVTVAGIAPVVDWLQRTVPAPMPLPPNDQVWMLKEAGTAAGLLGLFLMLFAAGGLWLRTPAFAPLRRAPARGAGGSGLGWWISALILIVVPAASYFWLNNQAGTWFEVRAAFPQQITNGLAVWAVGNAALALLLFLLWMLFAGPRAAAARAALGGNLLRALGLALATVGSGYALLLVVNGLFGTDFRAWVLAARPLDALHAQIAVPYLLPFAFFFVVLAMVLHGQLRAPQASQAAAVIGNGVLMGAGIAGLLLIQYVPLLSGQPLPLGEPLLTIVAFQLLVLLPVTGMLSSYLFEKTGSIWPGAFANALFVSWYVVASQATHVALG